MEALWPWLVIALSLALAASLIFILVQSNRLSEVDRDRQRFRLLWQNLPDIVTEIDQQGVILDVNHVVDGFCRDDVIGTDSDSHLTPELAALFREKLQQAMATRQVQRYEIDIAPQPGQIRRLQNQLVPVHTDGRLTSLMVISSDISEQVMAREVLEQQRDQAEEANLAKSRFLASMSHEIRTPMNGMLGMVSLLEQTELSTEQQSFLKVIQTSCDHLLAIINDILDISKIEANKLAIEEEPFQLHGMVEDLLGMVSAKAREKELVLQSFIEQGVPEHLVGDSVRIRQILMNYLTNAIKFTDQGHVLLRVVVVSSRGSQVHLRFSVEDSGIGIAASKAMHLFDEYTFAHGRLSTMVGGTGLGLSISRRLANLMGGKVGVVSTPAVGSNFWLDLTLTMGSMETATPAPQPQMVPRVSIWVADEVQVNRTLLVSVARRLEAPLREFGRSQELRSALDSEPTWPQILVLSRRMFELLDDRLDELCQRGVRIAVTFSEVVTFEEAFLRSKGVYGYWDWPITEDKLRQLLEALAQTGEQPEPLLTRYRRWAPADVIPEVSLQGKRILLAEDNLVNQKVATQMLSRIGCETIIANNGAEAVEHWRQGGFDLILMDCHMPEMDGLEATRIIRSSDQGGLIPILALSADVMGEQKKACVAAGMNDYLAKPIRLEELRQTLNAYLS